MATYFIYSGEKVFTVILVTKNEYLLSYASFQHLKYKLYFLISERLPFVLFSLISC